MRGNRWIVGAVVALVVAGACARPGAEQPDAAADPPSPAPMQADVVAIHPGPDDHSLIVDVEVPGGEPGCGENPRLGHHEEEHGRIFANVVADSPRSLVFGGCPRRTPATAVLRFEMVVAGKPLTINSTQFWDPGDPDYRLCPQHLGCHPPDDHCHRVWIDEAITHMDVPQHSYLDTKHCDQSWLVLDINTNAGACGAGRPDCTASPNVTRWFFRFTDRWTLIGGTRRAGCDDVLAREPAFPPAFCDLAPPGS